MVWVPGGRTTLGSEAFHPEEAPKRTAQVAGLWMDIHEVTNGQFAEFVAATGYVTAAERQRNGGAVFSGGGPGGLDVSQVWRVDQQASWRLPFGPGSSTSGLEALPVVQIAYEDALAYARWRGRDLPTEAEWERAARGGLSEAEYVWGAAPAHANGKPRANHWQGVFPIQDTADDGFRGLAPVGCFEANGYGLHDMAGNVWEWTKDPWPEATPVDGFVPGARVIKGGSWLCSDDFCHRYRPAARQPGDPSLGTSHLGFRTVLRAPGPETPSEETT
jgi:formylglycine-generating enzyme required for sulfatase activity